MLEPPQFIPGAIQAVTCVIPGSSRPEHMAENAVAGVRGKRGLEVLGGLVFFHSILKELTDHSLALPKTCEPNSIGRLESNLIPALPY